MTLTAARQIRKEFPDIGDDIYVVIKNPMLQPQDRLRPKQEPRKNADGEPDTEHAIELTYRAWAALIVEWHMIDATDEADEPRLLEGPINGDALRKVPAPVEAWLAKELRKATSPS